VIVFDQPNKPLQRISADGGTPAPILPLDTARGEASHQAPYFLPDGKHLVYYSFGKKGVSIMLASLDGKLNRMLVEGAAPVTYAPNPRGGGSMIYNVRGQLLARPFDLDKFEFTGPPAVLASGVGGGRWWYPSSNGILAFRHNYGTQYQLVWVSRDGRMLGAVGDPGVLATPRISPDQKMIAFSRNTDQNIDIWTFDLMRNTSARFTFQPGIDCYPIWSADGRSILYGSAPPGTTGPITVVERPANGVGTESVVVKASGNSLAPTAVSRDGRWLTLIEGDALHSVILLRSRDDSSKAIRVQDREQETDGSISPDGRWLLYSSVPVTRREVMVQSVPKEAGGPAAGAGKWQISMAGGSQPMWRTDGKEIFFVAPDGMMMAVPVESGDDFFRPGAPKPLFQTRLEFNPALVASRFVRQYDVMPDGQRFLLSQHVSDASDSPITVVVNWPKLLQK
jgi:Tol biopolymer transport system component